MKFNFNSVVAVGSEKMENYTQEQIKNEPMLFSCTLDSARSLGGPITNNFLDLLPWYVTQHKDLIIDSRVHMLMKDWYPCIPGWHHDDVPRTLSNGQPNYYNPEYNSQHVMCLVNGDICPTHFALGSSEFPDVNGDDKYYKVWHPIVEQKVKDRELNLFVAPSNVLIHFDWQSWHTGTKAVQDGWRWFIRCSYNTNRKPFNEIRRQVQVYLEFPMEGW